MDLPISLQKELREILKDEYDLFEAAMGEQSHGGLRFHMGKIKGGEEKIIGCEKSVPWAPYGYYSEEKKIAKHPYYHGGILYIQEPSAMAPAEILKPQKDDWVLDICAAPGGKSTRLSEFLGGSGFLVANDISNSRCRGLLHNLELFGMKNAVVTNEAPKRLGEHFGAVFDKVLVDAPCSGQGMFRKDPKLLKEYIERTDRDFPRWQKEIMADAARLTAPSGEIVYSTCTFTREEDEWIIKDFLHDHSDFSLVPISHQYGFAGGVDGFDQTARLWPHRIEGEGHFIAHLQKNGEKLPREFTSDNSEICAESLEIFKDFFIENQIKMPMGRIGEHKNSLFLTSETIPCCQGLKIVGKGLYLGDVKNKRFVPSQPWALSLTKDEVENHLSFPVESVEIADYLKGLTLKVEAPKGYILIFADDFPMGWVKSDGCGTLKNHYPKSWRNI
ncbi:MAG: RsmF rRNA methyltransferase first C-terminal domain-containing protein [Clostridiales bacterium]